MQLLKASVLCVTLALFCASCGGDTILFEVGPSYTVLDSRQCDCKALVLTSGTKKELMAEHVTTVMGSRERFLVGVTDPHLYSVQWFLFDETTPVQSSADLRPLSPTEVETVLEKLQIDFAKTFEQ